jgi:hypothetical protein
MGAQSEPAPTCSTMKDGWMDDKLSGNSFLLACSFLANHCGYLSCFFFPTYLLTTHKQVVSMYVLKKPLSMY